MESSDDDFGDIYADVEAQAVSAVGGVSGLGRRYAEPKVDSDNGDENNQGGCPGDGGVNSRSNGSNSTVGDGYPRPVEGCLSERSPAMEIDRSDSEDELNIVLNDDDYQVFPTKCDSTVRSLGAAFAGGEDDGDDHLGLKQEPAGRKGDNVNVAKGIHHSQYSQYKYTRPHVTVNSSIANDNGADGGAFFSSMLARVDIEDNMHNQQQGFCSNQVPGSCSTTFSGASLNGHGFSLPWYRTILDVNIDSFEHKPWKHPGADVTSFFNFGFDEESWKNYCKSLELIRQQASLQTRTPVYDLKANQGYENYFEKDGVARDVDSGEISTEPVFADREARQLGLPKGRAIHVEDSGNYERLPSTDVKRPRHRDSDVVIEIVVQDSVEPSSGTQKENGSCMELTGHGISKGVDFGETDNRGIHHVFNGNGDESSMGSLCKNAERSESKRCPPLETASHRSIKNSVDDVNDQKCDFEGCLRQKNVCASFHSMDAVETVNCKMKVASNTCFDAVPSTMKTGSCDGNKIEGSPSSSPFKRQSEASGSQDDPESLSSMSRPSSTSVSDNQVSVTSDFYITDDIKEGNDVIKMKRDDCENSSSRNSNLFQKQLTCSKKHSTAGKVHAHDNRFHLMSNRDSWNQSSIKKLRRKVTMRDLISYDRKDASNHRGIGTSLRHHGDRFGNNDARSYTKRLRRKSHQNFSDETEPYSQKKWGEQRQFLKERTSRVAKNIAGRDSYQCKRSPTIKDLDLHAYRESRYITSNHNSYVDRERDAWCRRRNGPSFMEIIHNNHRVFGCRDSDNLMQEGERDMQCRNKDDLFRKRVQIYECRPSDGCMRNKNGRSTTFTDMGRDIHGGYLKFTGREDFGRMERCTSPSLLDLESLQIKDSSWEHDDHRSYIGPSTSNSGEGCDIFPRYDLCDSRSTDLFGRARRQLYSEICSRKDGIDVSIGDDRVVCADNQVRFEKRYNWKPKKLCWAGNDSILRHQDDGLYAKEEPFYPEKLSNQERNYAQHGSVNNGMFIEDKQLDRHQYKNTRERRVNGKSSNVVRRDMLEDTVLRCRDPVDLVVGEGKKHFQNESLAGNGKQLQIINSKVVRPGDESSDMEEGQIVTEDSNGPENVRILEMRMKMEKRGERFRKPVAEKKKDDVIPVVSAAGSVAEVQENKQRPMRKRRWGGC